MKNPKELFNKIVELSKSALSTEEVNEVVEEVVEEVVLAEEPKVEEESAPQEAAPAEPVAAVTAVSKTEFDSAIAEIKEMYTKVLESISPSQPEEVPAALSAETTEEVVEEVKEEVELSEEIAEEEVSNEVSEEVELSEEVVDELVLNPEAIVEKKVQYLYSQNRSFTTEDAVFSTLFNK